MRIIFQKVVLSEAGKKSIIPGIMLILLLHNAITGQSIDAKALTAAHQVVRDGMVLIPGGVFLMGSDKAISRPDERPVHQVKVDPFWMDTTEVTNAQFKIFVDATHLCNNCRNTATNGRYYGATAAWI